MRASISVQIRDSAAKPARHVSIENKCDCTWGTYGVLRGAVLDKVRDCALRVGHMITIDAYGRATCFHQLPVSFKWTTEVFLEVSVPTIRRSGTSQVTKIHSLSILLNMK